MAFTTKVITDTSPDFGDNPQTITESGQPSSVEIINLVSNTGYYTKAEIWQDGTLNDTSEVESFQTLQAGTITLTFVSTVRNGNNYIVTYTVSSTYALSSAILSTNNTNFQGAISGNTITFTVSGLTHGDAYLYSVNAIDIYAESGTANGTITTTVINTVTISDVDEDETDVTCYMTYTIDSGFTQAWVEYWNENDDPSTDQPQGHNTFTEGETSCTLYNLAPGTTYQFRATIYYGGYVNYVVSNVVKATTATVDYSTKYFTITNTSNGNNTIGIRTESNNPIRSMTVDVSTNNGSSWTSKTTTLSDRNYVVTLATLASGNSLLIRHTGAWYPGALTYIESTASIEASGNVDSLVYGDNFLSNSSTVLPDNAYMSLFDKNTHIQSARNLVIQHTNLSTKCMESMFSGCTSLTSIPDLSHIVTVGSSGMRYMFSGCTSLVYAPDLSSVTSVGNNGMQHMFQNCSALVNPPLIEGITTVGDSTMDSMFKNCTSLSYGIDLKTISTAGTSAFASMYYGCSSLTEAYAPSITWDTSKTNNWLYGVASSGTLTADSSIASSITLNSVSGCPSDWTLDKYYECSDCYNWEECGYSSKEECDCIVNGNCE